MKSRRWTARIILTALVALTVPLVAVAHDTGFTDANDEDAFYHDEVGAIAGAGLTAGCTATTFCPDRTMTRGEAVTFLHRSIARVAFATATDMFLDGTVVSVELTPGGAVPGKTNMIVVEAVASVFGTGFGGGSVTISLSDGVDSSREVSVTAAAGETVHVPLMWAIEATTMAPAEPVTLSLVAAGNTGTSIDADIIASYVPLGPDGENELSPAP